MRGRRLKLGGVVMVAVAIALVLVACGGDSTATGSETSSDTAATSEPPPPKSPDPASAKIRASIENLGKEGSSAELEEAAIMLNAFLAARAGEDWKTTCSYLSKGLLEQLEALGLRVDHKENKGCPATFARLMSIAPPGRQSEATISEAEATSLRRRDKRVFLIYKADGSTYALLVMPQRGAWKVAEFRPTFLY